MVMLEARANVEIPDYMGKVKSISRKALATTIRETAVNIMKNILEYEFPAYVSTSSYITTGEMVNTVMFRVSGDTLVIYIDGGALSAMPYDAANHEFGIHEGVSGQDFRHELPGVLNDGGGGIVPHKGRIFMDTAFDQYQVILIELLAQELAAAGFEVSTG